MKIELFFTGIVLFIVGLLLLVFRDKVGKIYDKMNLTEKEREYYKNTVLRLLGFLLFILGFIMVIIALISNDLLQSVIKIFTKSKNMFLVLIGLSAICFGIFTIVIRILKKEEKFFAKYEPMKRQYGKIKGTFIHILGYTIIPLIFGIILIIKSL